MIACTISRSIIVTLGLAALVNATPALAQSGPVLSSRTQRPAAALQALQRARAPTPPTDVNDAPAPVKSIFEVTPYQASPTLARSTKGQVGQRRTAASLVPANRPLVRIDARIETRAQSRIANRLDRFNALQPALSPFAAAADQARIATVRRR